MEARIAYVVAGCTFVALGLIAFVLLRVQEGRGQKRLAEAEKELEAARERRIAIEASTARGHGGSSRSTPGVIPAGEPKVATLAYPTQLQPAFTIRTQTAQA